MIWVTFRVARCNVRLGVVLGVEENHRADVVWIFPYRDALIRLVGAVLADQHDEWIQQKCYIPLISLGQTKALSTDTVIDADATTPAGKEIAA